MRIASRSSITWLVALASIATVAQLARRPTAVATSEMMPQLQRVQRDLGRVGAEQRTRADRAELAAIERDLDAMIDRLQIAADAVEASTTDRERAIASETLSQLERQIHDRAQSEQARAEQLRARLGD